MKDYKDFHNAFIGTLQDVMENGTDITVREMPTKELRGHSFRVRYPTRRMLAIPERGTNPFAQIAETLWMLSGDDHLDWLELYIPQCKKWSDDGKTWRGAYGPRLRHWRRNNVDQLYEVQNLLKKDPQTRQAVMSIWDPGADWVESKDIPCNNWLQFLIRDEMLHLHVAVRSNDAVYGFSHNDFFSWSVLLEMMARWVGVTTGSITWFAGSYHIYDRHYDLAESISGTSMMSMYETDPLSIRRALFDTDFEFFDSSLNTVLQSERSIRNMVATGKDDSLYDHIKNQEKYHDMFMFTSLQMMGAYILHKSGEIDKVVEVVQSIHDCDMKVAAIVYFLRKEYPIDKLKHGIEDHTVRTFVEYHFSKFQ